MSIKFRNNWECSSLANQMKRLWQAIGENQTQKRKEKKNNEIIDQRIKEKNIYMELICFHQTI
jgi:hypothetical protein